MHCNYLQKGWILVIACNDQESSILILVKQSTGHRDYDEVDKIYSIVKRQLEGYSFLAINKISFKYQTH